MDVMSSTPSTNASVGVPASGVQLAKAIALHREYWNATLEWNRWLAETEPFKPTSPGGLPNLRVSNADKFTLWKLISEMIRRRSKGGEWANVDKKVIPPADELQGMLRSEFATFEERVKKLREPVEDAAGKLANFLSTTEFLTEFNTQLDEAAQWKYAADLLDGFADSWAGKTYLSHSLGQSTSPMPMAHPDRLLGTARNLRDLSTDMSAIRNYTKLFLKLAPLLVKDPKFEGVWFNFIQRNFPAAVWENKKNFQEVLDGTLRYLPKIDWPWWQTAKGAAEAFTAALEIVTLAYYANKVAKDPSALNIAKLGKATFSTIKAIGAVSKKAYGESFPLAFSDSTKYLLSGPGAALDIYMAAAEVMESTKAADIGDYSVATGHALQGVGLAVGAAESTGALAGLGLAAGPIGWIAVGGLALVLVGFLLVELTKDPPIETWLENTWFGRNWEALTETGDPASPTFLVKEPGGFPRIDRQIAWWYTAFDPIGATATYSTTSQELFVTCAPRRARRASWVTVNLFTIDTVTQSVTVLSQQISETLVGLTRYAPTYDANDPDAVVAWQCNLRLDDLTSKGVNAGTDFTKCWVEVLVSAPLDVLDGAALTAYTQNTKKFVFQARDLVPVKVQEA